MEPSTLTLIISLVVYTLIVLGITELFRRHIRIAAVFIILSLFTFPLWAAHRDSWFEWMKIISVLVPTAMVGLMRIAVFEDRKGSFWKPFKQKWILWFFYGILFLNIVEASIRDWELGNILNALTGFILCVTIPFATKYWRVDKRERGDLIADFPKGWCLLYTTWNAGFLLGCIPDEFVGGLAILIAAEFYAIKGRPDLYVMARVYTLAIFVLQLGIFDVFPFMDSSAWYNPTLVKWWGLANLVFGVVYLFWYIHQLRTGKAEKSFRNPHTAPQEAI